MIKDLKITDFCDDKSNENKLASTMIKLFNDNDASKFFIDLLNSVIPSITKGMIKPCDMYYDDKKNSLVIKFNIATKDNQYDVIITVMRTDKKGFGMFKYKFIIEGNNSKHIITYAKKFEYTRSNDLDDVKDL